MHTPIKKLAQILRCKPKVLIDLFDKMESLTGIKQVPDKIIEQNKERMEKVLEKLDVRNRTGEEIFKALIYHIKKSNTYLEDFFNHPTFSDPASYDPVKKKALWLAGNPRGYFLKKDKARQLLVNHPPKNMIEAFSYSGVDELLEKEDLFEIYSALRFIEPGDWLNDVFLESYKSLTPDDFIERDIEVIILPHKWLRLAREFIEKKYHNLSHLKELGVVFIIPIEDQAAGNLLRLFSLLLHYLHEIPFYSRLFQKYSKQDHFAQKLIEALQGKVISLDNLPQKDNAWMIVQRYLAKADKKDPRLFVPHVNPEALHWEKAEDDIANFAQKVPEIDLNIWRDLDWVGDFYPSQKEGEVLVSFDLIDNVMSLVKEEELIKYLYHHQEALWNKIFKEFMGAEKLESMIIENFEKGYIELTTDNNDSNNDSNNDNDNDN